MKRKVRFGVVGLAAATVTLGGIAFAQARELFRRPGEAVTRLIPESAMGVLVIDLTPSPTQLFAFERINASVPESDLQSVVKSMLTGMIPEPKLVEQIVPFVDRGAALTALDHKDPFESMVVLLALKDGPQVDRVLSRAIKPTNLRGLKYYRIKDQLCLSVMDNFLVMNPKPENLQTLKQVQMGLAKPLNQNADFVSAWDRRGSNANVTLMIRLDARDKDYQMLTGSFENEGIRVAVDAHINTDEKSQKFFDVKPFDRRLMNLPSGAYFAIGLSNIGSIDDLAKDDSKLRDALKGSMYVALYPRYDRAASGPVGVDLLAYMGGQNGANPMPLMDEMRKALSAAISVDESKPAFVRQDAPGANVWTLNPALREKMMRDMAADLPEQLDRDVLLDGKTLTMAHVLDQNAAFASTNPLLLQGAIARTSSAAAPADRAWIPSGQLGLRADLPRMLEGFQSLTKPEKMKPEDQQAMNELAKLAGAGRYAELGLQLKPNGDGKLEFFIPIDYEAAFKLGRNIEKRVAASGPASGTKSGR